MKKHIIIPLTLLCLLFSMFGCSQNSQTPNELLVSDILRAFGMKWWNVNLPDDIGSGDHIELNVINHDGEVVCRSGGIGGANLGSTVKVLVWPNINPEIMNKCMITPNGSARGGMENKFQNFSTEWLTSGETVSIGDILMKGTTNNLSFAGSRSRIEVGELGLTVNISRN